MRDGKIAVAYPLSTPPVDFSTLAITDFASLSRSSSVKVRSRGWMVISMATDFLPSPSEAPSNRSKTLTPVTSALSAPWAARTSVAAGTALSTTKAKSRRSAWKAESDNTGLVRVALRLASGIASMNTSKPASGPVTSSASSVEG